MEIHGRQQLEEEGENMGFSLMMIMGKDYFKDDAHRYGFVQVTAGTIPSKP